MRLSLYMAAIVLLISQWCFGQGNGKILKYKIVKAPDSVQTISATWTVDTVLVKGDPKCNHEWQTVPGGENQKYTSAPDSLRMILNPRGERVVQEECLKCDAERIKSENITTKRIKIKK